MRLSNEPSYGLLVPDLTIKVKSEDKAIVPTVRGPSRYKDGDNVDIELPVSYSPYAVV